MVAGLTFGLADVDVKPDGLLTQEYVKPAELAAPKLADAPLQMLVAEPALETGPGLTVMILPEELSLQPRLVVITTLYVPPVVA